jgi:hypothetical protein
MKNYKFVSNNSSNSDAIMAELKKAEDSYILNSPNLYNICNQE